MPGHPRCGLLMRTTAGHSSFMPDTLTHFCLSAGMEQDAQPAQEHLPRDSRCLVASETSALTSRRRDIPAQYSPVLFGNLCVSFSRPVRPRRHDGFQRSLDQRRVTGVTRRRALSCTPAILMNIENLVALRDCLASVPRCIIAV